MVRHLSLVYNSTLKCVFSRFETIKTFFNSATVKFVSDTTIEVSIMKISFGFFNVLDSGLTCVKGFQTPSATRTYWNSRCCVTSVDGITVAQCYGIKHPLFLNRFEYKKRKSWSLYTCLISSF